MTPTRAVLLLRISYRKAEDDEQTSEVEAARAEFSKGIGRQEEDGRALAKRLGWTVTKVIPEDDTSAFKRRKIKLPDGTTALRTVRPGFRAALDMLASGECDGLIADDLDRVARDPRDLEDLIDVVESRRPRIPVESVTGSLRLANDADITMARIMCAVANKSSRDTSRRVSRKHEELAAEGRVGGGGFRPYGYERDGVTVCEAEAEVIRWMAARVLEGWSQNEICDDLNARGIRPAKAATWNSRSVSSILRGPRITGLRRFRGEVIGDASWPAIIDRETWHDVQTRLDKRGGGSRNDFVRWLTGALYCSRCDRPLCGWQGNRGPRYWCATPRGGCGKITINAAHAEAEVERQVLDFLGKRDVLARLRSLASTETSAAARAELAEDEGQLKVLAGMWARREMGLQEYTEARRIIAARVKESEALVKSQAPRVLRALLAGDVREGWAELKPAGRREVLLAILPGYRVMPMAEGVARRFDPARLVPLDPAT